MTRSASAGSGHTLLTRSASAASAGSGHTLLTRSGSAAWRRLRRDEHGVVGGLEALAFGVLIFVAGTLIVAHAWGVIDAKVATTAAAREAARAYVEAPDASSAAASAHAAAAATLVAHGRAEGGRRSIRPVGPVSFARCSRVTWEVTYAVPAVAAPWVGRVGSGVTVRGRHSELVDPLRSGVPGEAGCVSG